MVPLLPVSFDEFAVAMDALGVTPWPRRIAVAVSGGADSMALCLLAHSWAKDRSIHLTALTVDHGLRAESAREAEQVARWLLMRGIDHHILRWNAPPTKPANAQAQARDARYRLLAEWSEANGIAHLLLGHHQDDQAETFLIRLGRGSGVDGLAAMRPVSRHHGLILLRPLLEIAKPRLIATLQAREQPWVEDPSNDSARFTRTRMRQLLPLLEEAGITPAELARTCGRMARAASFLEQTTAAAYAQLVHANADGLALDQPGFSRLHPEIGLRVLAKAVQTMSGQPYRPRFGHLERLYNAICQSEPKLARNLGGCTFRSQRNGVVSITYEQHGKIKSASCG